MITEWDIYWITRLGCVNTLAVTTFVLCFVGLFICAFEAILASIGEAESRLRRAVPWLVSVAAAAALVLTFTPTTKEMVAIRVIPHVVNNAEEYADRVIALCERLGLVKDADRAWADGDGRLKERTGDR